MKLFPVLLFLHLVSVVVWVGGMFFAYVCLRPVAAALLEPPGRLALWSAVLGSFFRWVWLAVALILLSGLAMMTIIGWSKAPWTLHAMLTVGVIMMMIFAHVFFAPYRKLRDAVMIAEWPPAAAALNQIRKMVGINLLLGVATIAMATLGIYGSR